MRTFILFLIFLICFSFTAEANEDLKRCRFERGIHYLERLAYVEDRGLPRGAEYDLARSYVTAFAAFLKSGSCADSWSARLYPNDVRAAQAELLRLLAKTQWDKDGFINEEEQQAVRNNHGLRILLE